MWLWITTAAMMFAGFATAQPTKIESSMPPQLVEIIIQQLCSSKDILDCHSKARECISMMNSMSGSGVPKCPGLETADCLLKLIECSGIITGSSQEQQPEPESEEGMSRIFHRNAEIMCLFSAEASCKQDVISCLKLAEQLMKGSSSMTPKRYHSMCANVDIVDCETKLMSCDEKMEVLANKMRALTNSGEMTSNVGLDMPPETTAMVLCSGNQEPDCEEKASKCIVLSNAAMMAIEKSSKLNSYICGTTDLADCLVQLMNCNEFMEGLVKKPNPVFYDMTSRKRRKRNTDKTVEESTESRESYEDPSRPLASLDVFIVQVDRLMMQIDEMLAQFSKIMGVIETVMDEKTEVLGMKPGILSRKEKAMYLIKYMCNQEDNEDCAFMTEECAVWLAPSPNLPAMDRLKDVCSGIVPPKSSVADSCLDFSTSECMAEAVSCMNLLTATGGTSGYAGPLTPHSAQCEDMLRRMISSVSCVNKDNTTECEMAMEVCMDTIRVKTDELNDHHFPEKLMCEPVMRPAVALYMCSVRDEPDCFSRMHKCLVNMSPESGDMKEINPEEMKACLKLTRPPVELICTSKKGADCHENYDACNSLIQPNTEFLKAAQACMGLPDEMGAKMCLQSSLNQMANSIDNVSVQDGIKDLFQNFWTPSMGIVGIHSCMMMVCTMEIE